MYCNFPSNRSMDAWNLVDRLQVWLLDPWIDDKWRGGSFCWTCHCQFPQVNFLMFSKGSVSSCVLWVFLGSSQVRLGGYHPFLFLPSVYPSSPLKVAGLICEGHLKEDHAIDRFYHDVYDAVDVSVTRWEYILGALPCLFGEADVLTPFGIALFHRFHSLYCFILEGVDLDHIKRSKTPSFWLLIRVISQMLWFVLTGCGLWWYAKKISAFIHGTKTSSWLIYQRNHMGTLEDLEAFSMGIILSNPSRESLWTKQNSMV